jgi:hypothetical protein
MQDNHDGGGRCRILLPVKFWGKKVNKAKFVVAYGGRQSTIKHYNKPNTRRRGSGGICDWWGEQGELYLIVFGRD